MNKNASIVRLNDARIQPIAFDTGRPVARHLSQPRISRRIFIAQAAAAGTLALGAGCDNFEGVGPAPDGRRAAVAAGVFGFSIDWYANGTFRVNADFRKVALCGLFLAGGVPAAAVIAGNALITLWDKANSSHYALSVASSGISGANLVHPSFDFEVNLAEFLPSSGAATMKFEVFDDRPEFSLESPPAVGDLDFLAGTWKAFAPSGDIVNFNFRPTKRDSSIAVDSVGFAAAATFRIERQYEQSDTACAATVIEGSISGTFRQDPSRASRSSPLKLTCLDRNTIQAETRYLRWDGAGRTAQPLFWPFRMVRIG